MEPSGESVIAGRAPAEAVVKLMVGGRVFAEGKADGAGSFALIPPPLPPGAHEIAIEALGSDGRIARSAQTATIALAENRLERPLVTLAAPGQPTTVLSRPDPAHGPAQTAAATASGGVGRRSEPAVSMQASAGAAPTSAPEAARTGLEIAAVDAESAGRLHVSGVGRPGASIRLYLNQSFVAEGSPGPDGRIAFTIERGVRPGQYGVRLDEVDPRTGAVSARSEVGFTMPASLAGATSDSRIAAAPSLVERAQPEAVQTPVSPTAGPTSERVAAAPPAPASTAASQPPIGSRVAAATDAAADIAAASSPKPAPAKAETGLASVVVPELNTAVVTRGDSLWAISKRAYGHGLRYTVIYGANTPQIRNPHLIYPGQVFVLPAASAGGPPR